MQQSTSSRAGSAGRFFSGGIVGAAVFAGAYTLAALVGAIATGNTEFIFYLVVMVVLAALIVVVHARFSLSTPLLWALAIWGGLHMAGGLVPVPESWPINGETRVLYSWWIIFVDGTGVLKFDQVVHAYGFGTATWLWWELLRAMIERRTGELVSPSMGLIVLCIAGATGLGAANEIVEFSATLIADTNVGGYRNTALDLVSNLTGAVIAGVLIAVVDRRAASRERHSDRM